MTDQELEDSFKITIAKNPRDWTARKVYSDWLEEHDRPEEADYQRGWNDEKQDSLEWIEDFVQEIERYSMERATYGDYDEEGNEGRPYLHHDEVYHVSVDELLKRAEDAFLGKHRSYKSQYVYLSFDIDDNGLCLPFNTPDFVGEKEEKFLEHCRIVLGLKEGEGRKVEYFFWCAC